MKLEYLKLFNSGLSWDYIASLDIADIRQWLNVAKAKEIKDKIKLIEALSLLILPETKKHAIRINQKLDKLQKEYEEILGVSEIHKEKNIKETNDMLESIFENVENA